MTRQILELTLHFYQAQMGSVHSEMDERPDV